MHIYSFLIDVTCWLIAMLYKKGLSVAQVRLIFQLPPEYGRFDTPLAYLEWYNLQSYIPSLGMYQVTCSY